MNEIDPLPELVLDRKRFKVIENFDDSDEIEYWKNTTYAERLEYAYRLRYMAYGDKIRERISRVFEVVEPK
jgi:hypothetical protein